MTFKGRSLDDLPLAAYSTGMEPESRAADPVTEPAAEPSAPPTFAPPALGAPDDEAAAVPDAAPPRRPTLPPWLANPRENLRDPRLLMTGVIGVGVVLLVASLVFGGGPAAGSGDPGASATGPVANATAAPPSGDATVEVSGKLTGSYVLAGATGTGPATGGHLSTTWVDATGATLALEGAASSGTRTTDPTFVLTWSLMVDGVAATFTSDGGECTVGMSVQPRTVSGSFVCKKLKSDDGKLTVDVRGTYRT